MVRIPTSFKKIEKQRAESLAITNEALLPSLQISTFQVVRVTMVNFFTIPLYL